LIRRTAFSSAVLLFVFPIIHTQLFIIHNFLFIIQRFCVHNYSHTQLFLFTIIAQLLHNFIINNYYTQLFITLNYCTTERKIWFEL